MQQKEELQLNIGIKRLKKKTAPGKTANKGKGLWEVPNHQSNKTKTLFLTYNTKSLAHYSSNAAEREENKILTGSVSQNN